MIDNILSNITANKKSQFRLFFIVLLFLTLFTMYCCGPTTSYSGYDFFFHFRRLDVLINALREGSYPIYFDYSNVDGYGYFAKGFYPDLVLLPFACIGVFTSTYFAYDVTIFVMTMLCGIFTYKAVNTIYRSTFAASVTAILYTFATYRLFDVYHRGALGEAISFTFIPLIFLGLYHIIKGDYRKWYILTIGYTLLIYTHLISSVLMFITLIPFLIYYYKSFKEEPKRIWFLLLAGLVTVVLISYYLFPVLEQMMSNTFYYQTHTPGGRAGYNKLAFDLVGWGFINGLAYPTGKFFCGTGILLTIAILLRLFVRGKSTALRSVDICVVIGIIYIFATSKAFPWGTFPFSLIGFIQYPWRLFEFSSLFFALAGGFYLSQLLKTSRQKMIAMLIIITASAGVIINHSINFKYLYSQKVFQFYEGDSNEKPSVKNKYHLIGQEYFPSKIPSYLFFEDRGMVVKSDNEGTRIENLKRENKYTLFNVTVSKPDKLELPLIYYKGYDVRLNDEELEIGQSKQGLVEVSVNQPGRVVAYYKGTTIQIVSFYISIISIFAFCIYVLYSRRKVKQNYINRK